VADGADSIDDGHEAAANGAEDALDLEDMLVGYLDCMKYVGIAYARNDGTHVDDEDGLLGGGGLYLRLMV
jgi:hypothetical protein